MKRNKIFLVLFIFSQMLFITGCDSDFEEINTNPNDPSVVPSELLLAGTLRSTADRVQDSFLAGEAASTWVQHLAKLLYNDADRYIPRQNSIANFWNVLYASVIKDADVMQNLAMEEENSNMQGVALVIKAHAYQLLADSFGAIPMSEAGQGDQGNFTPSYDPASEVYPNIIEMLTEADALLNGNGEINASQDLLYGGDWMKWKKFANSLKFRVIMRASGNSSYTVGNQLQQLVNEGNLFESNEDGAVMTYLPAEPNANPWFEALVMGNRTTEWTLGEALVEYMQTTNDPRLPVYAQEVGGNGSGNGYVGIPAGYFNPSAQGWNANTTSLIGEFYLEAEAPAFFLEYSQLELLMAEAAEKGYISGSAAEHYNAGIEADLEANGLTATNFYPVYSGGQAGLEQIAKQEWVALYMHGMEAWAEVRRKSDIFLEGSDPFLDPAEDGVIDEIPSRLNYPVSEQSLNPTSYGEAIAAQGDDLLTTPIWWQL